MLRSQKPWDARRRRKKQSSSARPRPISVEIMWNRICYWKPQSFEYLARCARLWHRFKLDKSKWIPAEPICVIPENIWIGFRRSILSTFNNDIQHHFSSPLIFHENRFIIRSTEGLRSAGIGPSGVYHTDCFCIGCNTYSTLFYRVNRNRTTVKVTALL